MSTLHNYFAILTRVPTFTKAIFDFILDLLYIFTYFGWLSFEFYKYVLHLKFALAVLEIKEIWYKNVHFQYPL